MLISVTATDLQMFSSHSLVQLHFGGGGEGVDGNMVFKKRINQLVVATL